MAFDKLRLELNNEALGLATVAIGAFNDEQVRKVLLLDKQYKPLYIIPLGVGLHSGDESLIGRRKMKTR